MERSSIHSITFTNKGYIDYTHNLLESIKKNDTDTQLEVIAIDNESFDYFKSIYDDVSFFSSDFVKEQKCSLH